MANPPEFGQPDRTGSGKWFFDPDTDLEKGDNGGVHENSGVGGKAAFLMTDGGTFNGQTMTGLGEEKTLQITYDVADNMLTSASDYQDYGHDLEQACSDLVGEHEITGGDCEQMKRSCSRPKWRNRRRRRPRRRRASAARQETQVPAFSDDLENPASGNWKFEPSKKESVFFFPRNRPKKPVSTRPTQPAERGTSGASTREKSRTRRSR